MSKKSKKQTKKVTIEKQSSEKEKLKKAVEFYKEKIRNGQKEN